MTKATPGPWRLMRKDERPTEFRGRTIALSGGPGGIRVVAFGIVLKVEHLANASLIAAAPALLDAATRALEILEADPQPATALVRQSLFDAICAALGRDPENPALPSR